MSEQSAVSCECSVGSGRLELVAGSKRANYKTMAAKMIDWRGEVSFRTIAKRFYVREVIGLGAFGTVYDGLNTKTGNSISTDIACNHQLS